MEYKTIESYFKSIDGESKHIFPGNFNYVTTYNFISQNLITKIHPFVEKGAMNADNEIFLNDHGPEHIQKVIFRATELLNCFSAGFKLSEYETFLLLVAIHIHDIGNIYGRDNHEINSINVIKALGLECAMDRIEWECVFDIAEAHGGKPKDKISSLVEEKVLNFVVRRRTLAAILKFADELADDRTRANRFALITGEMKEYSKLHHKFSYCLHTVDVDKTGKQIKLIFDVEENDLIDKYKKKTKSGEEEVSLLDEIYNRTYKTHLERVYCSRFLKTQIEFERVRVAIVITLNKLNQYNKPEKRTITYDLCEKGYPDESMDGFFVICPELKEYSGDIVVGKIKDNTFKDVTVTN